MNQRQKKKQKQIENKKLIDKYPFLLPRNRWTGKVPKDYNYSHTELDAMPKGWRKAFGLLICEDIKNALIKEDFLYDYRIMDIKEKYGTLRWYDGGSSQEIYDIIANYEYISGYICIECGKFNVDMFDDGWISPYCDKCFLNHRNIVNRNIEKFGGKPQKTDINEFRCEHTPFNVKRTVQSFDKNGEIKRQVDCTDILMRMQIKGYCY